MAQHMRILPSFCRIALPSCTGRAVLKDPGEYFCSVAEDERGETQGKEGVCNGGIICQILFYVVVGLGLLMESDCFSPHICVKVNPGDLCAD